MYDWLAQHPSVFVSPEKEPSYFAFAGQEPRPMGDILPITDLDAYQSLFAGGDEAGSIGEGSTIYLYDPSAPERIRSLLPEVKLVAILRHPVDRAYSSFAQLRRDALEPLSDFRDAVAAEEERVGAGWPFPFHYLRAGRYAAQLRRYRERFPRDRLKVYLYDDLLTDPAALVGDLYRFLDVDPAFVPDVDRRRNVSQLPRSPRLQKLVRRPPAVARSATRALLPARARARIASAISARNLGPPPRLDPALRRALTKSFESEIHDLAALLGRDLSRWLDPSPS